MTIPPFVSEDGNHTVYFHTSARMREIPDATVDLTVTSPPYGLGLPYSTQPMFFEKRENVEMQISSLKDYRKFLNGLKPIWREVYRVTRPGGYILIDVAPTHAQSSRFGHAFMLPLPNDIADFFRHELKAEFRWEYVWVAGRARTNSAGMPVAFLGSYPKPIEGHVLREVEKILVLRKVPFTQEQLWHDDRKERRKRSALTDSDWRRVYSQVWEFPGAPKENVDGVEHPAPFPLELPRRALLGYSCVGDTVLDPFMGTGTTALAAKMLGRKSIGYEIESRFRRFVELKLQDGVASMNEEW